MLEEARLEEEITKVSEWVRDYVERAGSKGLVVGCSGGKDSAVVIAIATKAVGKENVIAVAMPCNSRACDLEDAKLVANTFNVPLWEIDLTQSYATLKEAIKRQTEQLSSESKINMKPRMRMTTLYAIAQSLNYLVIGTGNLSEAMVGYTTKWGDSAADLNPIGNFTMEEVLMIGKLLGVPQRILEKEPSDGLGELTDEEKLGIKYCQIAEYIYTGRTDPNVMEKIQGRYQASKHKRNPVPTYFVERKNYMVEQ